MIDIAGGIHKQIAFTPDLGGQAHHAGFAQRVNRRIGHLRKRLPEAVVQRPHALADRGHRHVIAHRANCFLLQLGQRPQHAFLFVVGELEQFLEAVHGGIIERHIGQHRVDQLGVQIGHALLEPLLVRRARAVDGIDGVVVQQTPCLQIHRDHFARAQLAFGLHALGGDVEDTRLRGDDEQAIGGQRPARRTQAIAVQRAGGVFAIAGHHPRRAIPRLGIDGVVLVERGQIRILVFQ